MTHRHITQNLNPQQQCWENRKSRTFLTFAKMFGNVCSSMWTNLKVGSADGNIN